MIKTTKKLIKIGSSLGVTLSKQELVKLDAKRGDSLDLSVERTYGPDKHAKLLREYNAFVAEYSSTLASLAQK
jgi:hypothetical protein